ncbi:MAG: toxin-antitoxin system, antitoxin component [Methanobacteriota archaeon]
MPTLKKRINLSVPEDIEKALTLLAKRDRVPVTTKTMELLEEALEIEEDRVLLAIAEEREAMGGELIPFEKVWKQRTK